MNKVILMGRLTRDPEVRYTQGERPMAIARYTLAVDRRRSRNNDGQPMADFINCVVFEKGGEFAEKYFRKGQRVLVSGRIQTGSYTNRDGQKVYTTEVAVEDQEFADSKSSGGNEVGNGGNAENSMAGSSGGGYTNAPAGIGDGFMNIPDELDGLDGLPFN